MALITPQIRNQLIERRAFNIMPTSIRSASETTAQFTGIAFRISRPNPVTDFMGEYLETVHPGATKRHLSGSQPIPLLLNHNAASVPLARWPGSLGLRETAEGLECRCDLDLRSPSALDVAIALERRDLTSMSYAFTAQEQKWSADFANREIFSMTIYDVSVVTSPMDKTTTATIGGRSTEDDAQARAVAIVHWAEGEQRAGRKISAKNMERVVAAHAAIKTAATHLKALASSNTVQPLVGDAGLDADAGGGSSSTITPADGMGPRSATIVPGVQQAVDHLLLLKFRQARLGGSLSVPTSWKLSPAGQLKLRKEIAEEKAHVDPTKAPAGSKLIRHHVAVLDRAAKLRTERRRAT